MISFYRFSVQHFLITQRLRHILIVLLSCLLSACAVAVRDFPAPQPLPEAFSASGDIAAPPQWWEAFDDAPLQRLIEQGLRDNPDLIAAYHRIEQAAAQARAAGSALFPALDAHSGADYALSDPPATGWRSREEMMLGFAASYEIDLWGRIRANIYAAEQVALAVAEERAAAAVSLSAEIASTWYHYVEQKQQLALLQRQIATNEHNVELVRSRFYANQASGADVFQQSQFLEALRGDRYSVEANLRVLTHRLAVLIGTTPERLRLPDAASFPALPPLPETGLPIVLLQRRPDILAAYHRLQAADLRIAAAIAERLPKLSLAVSASGSAPDLQHFFNNWLATLAGNLLLPIVDGGRRVAEVERQRAAAAEALQRYRQQILQALAEVENALAQERQQRLRLESLRQQLHALDEANQLIRLRYLYGAMDFLRVLTSLINLQNMERSVLRAERELIDFRIALYRALAGSESLPRPRTELHDAS